LAEAIPDGYEVYENPNAQVFLRLIQPKLITDIEKAIVEKGMKAYSKVSDYQIDIKGETITIYIADQDREALSERFQSLSFLHPEGFIDKVLKESLTFTPMLRFILTDDEHRKFVAQRYCFRGSIDDWIEIGGPDSLEKLVKEFVKHLGQESFYDILPWG
jgi:hypothetical protein